MLQHLVIIYILFYITNKTEIFKKQIFMSLNVLFNIKPSIQADTFCIFDVSKKNKEEDYCVFNSDVPYSLS